jgi:hypothetical protein
MSTLRTTYDESQHCIAVDQVKGKSGTMDCPYTGKGEELSPGNLLEAALSAAPNKLARFARLNGVSWQRIDVHLGIPDQRNSPLNRLGPHVSVAPSGPRIRPRVFRLFRVTEAGRGVCEVYRGAHVSVRLNSKLPNSNAVIPSA